MTSFWDTLGSLFKKAIDESKMDEAFTKFLQSLAGIAQKAQEQDKQGEESDE